MQLAGGMQVARPVPGGGGDAIALHHPAAQLPQGILQRARFGQVGEDSQVVAGIAVAQQGLQCGGVAGGRRRQLPRAAVAVQGADGAVFGVLHIGLVKGMNAQDVAGNGSSILPAVELGAQMVDVGQFQRRCGMAGAMQAGQRGIGGGVVIAGQAQVDEKAVGAVSLRVGQRFGGNGDDAASVLAGAFGQQLLRPEAKAGDAGGCRQGQFIPPLLRQSSDGGAEPGPGVAGRRPGRQALPLHLCRRRQQTGQVHANQRGRRQPKVRQRRIAPADVRVVEESPAETLGLRQLRQGRIRVGYGDEVGAAGAVANGGSIHQMAEVGVKCQRFGSGAGFGRHYKQSARRIQPGGGIRYPRRNGAVQREHLRVAGAAAESLPDDLGPQAAAAHPQQDDMAVAGNAHFPSELLQGVGGLGHILRQGKPGQAVGDFIRAVGPEGMVAGADAGRHGGGVQPCQHSGHRILIFPQQVAVGHCNHPCGPGLVGRACWPSLVGRA